MKDISVVIVSYNTKDIISKCIETLEACLKKTNLVYDIFVVDNNSSDGSRELLSSLKNINTYFLKENIGFSRANNHIIPFLSSRYVLYLNSDVIHNSNIDYSEILSYMDKYSKIGALTVKVMLNEKSIDWACHRGFPTIWRSFCYFAKLEKIFSKVKFLNKFFCGYHMMYEDLDVIHMVECITGAFYLTRTDLVKKLNGFDESFFMYGEDIDLSYRIFKKGFFITYYPKYTVNHLKSLSGIKNTNKKLSKKTKSYFYDSMKIFYQKHYSKLHNSLTNKVVFAIIDLFKNKS